MAKKVINSYYTFDAANDTVTVPGFVKKEELFLITDVTNNKILYNFADTSKGFDSVAYNAVDEATTIYLSTDASALGCTDSDNLQIIVDRVNEKIDVADSLLDPVHKIRVSNPENLIDTDFEYGLQPTKWETLEMSNFIPSFYVAEGTNSLETVTAVNAINGSNEIRVATSEPSGLAIGTPIDVQGLSSRTAEGKYLIDAVDSSGFSYIATAAQTKTGDIGSVYTTVTPGTFYTGSQIPFDVATGFSSDGDSSSTITITTLSPHGFADSSNFYLINTVGSVSQSLTDSAASTAPDGRPYVDDSDQLSSTVNIDETKTETRHMRARWSTKFTTSDVNTSNNTITWTGHGMKTNDCVLFVPSANDTQPGGLNRFDVYYVIKYDNDNLQFTKTYNGSAISLTSTGTNNYGRHSLHLVYEIDRIYSAYRSYNTQWYTRAGFSGTNEGSGWDLYETIDGSTGLGDGNAEYIIPISTVNNTNMYYAMYMMSRRGIHYGPRYSSSFTLQESSNLPTTYNFMEDFTWWAGNNDWVSEGFGNRMLSGAGLTTNANYNFVTTNYYPDDLTVFLIPLVEDEERDTFFAEDHGMNTNDQVVITTDTGNGFNTSGQTSSSYTASGTTHSSPTTYAVEKVSDDRFRLLNKRIAFLNGTYTGSAIITNPTKDSFYLPDHGLTNNQNITFSLETGAALPSAQTGPILPDYGTGLSNTNVTYFATLKSAIDDYLSSNSIDTQDIVTAPGTGNAPIQSGVSSGNAPIRYYSFNRGGSPNVYFNGSGVTIPIANVFPDQLSSTSGKNILSGTTQTANQLIMHGTDWAPNSTVPYYMYTIQAKRANSSTYWNLRFYDGIETVTAGAYRTYGAVLNQSYNATSGNNYRYSYTYAKHYYSTGPGAVFFTLTFKNYSDWESYTTNTYAQYSSNGNSYYYVQGTTSTSYSMKDEIRMGILIYTDNAETWGNSSSDYSALAQGVLEYFDVNSVYSGLSNGGTFRVGLINNNRFSLSPTSGPTINLQSKGTSPFTFSTQGNLGIIDGAYTSKSADSDQLVFQTSKQVNGASVTINKAAISGENFQVNTGTHTFLDGTSVTYSTDSNGSALTGLTNGSTYYVSVIDDEYFSLASTYDDAVDKTNLISSAADSSEATHSITTSSLAGIVKAAGTVSTTLGSSKVEGDNDTLFKRYFKPGDNIYIKNNNSTPGEIASFVVTTVADDNNLTVEEAIGFTASDTSHYVETKIYARPDGYAVHRPFDGGVEIAAGTAPFSHICRQTRKYFRYQSGKGIQTSLAINFNPPVTFESLTSSGVVATGRTKYPHRLSNGQTIKVHGADDATYNGTFTVDSASGIIDDFNFKFDLPQTPTTSIPGGIVKYNLDGYSGAVTRAGMFDFQNGFFFEYNGNELACVRRSSTTQLSGTAICSKNSSIVIGEDTNFSGQLNVGDRVVLRGQSYKVVKIDNRTRMYVQPQFRGVSTTGAIVTKTEDVRVPQSEWNIDKCDGTGPEGFILDIDKIQMAYMDYSWYGAGKIRFGFKDREGHVRYVHEFVHNNRLDEAYMRSGNIPAKYEVENGENPTYAPTLFHWGTSVIMDGTFDDDKAYLFTAPSNNLTFTNGDADTATTNGNGALYSRWAGFGRFDWYLRLSFATTDADKFYNGLSLYTADNELEGEKVDFTSYGGSNFYVYIYLQSSRNEPAVYPTVNSGTAVSLGAASAGGDTDVELGTDIIPLVSLRLAPSVDGNITGDVGERDIINRMQLQLNEVGLILTHDCEVKLILNADLSSVLWQNVASPSLSQLIKHNVGDTVNGGTEVFSFRAPGGTTDNTGKRLSNTSNFSLGDIIDMGNCILGGDGAFPNGPDVLTVAVQVIDTGGIDADNPFGTSARITWSESQA